MKNIMSGEGNVAGAEGKYRDNETGNFIMRI